MSKSEIRISGDEELWQQLIRAKLERLFKILLALSKSGKDLERLHNMLNPDCRLLPPDLKKLKAQRKAMAAREVGQDESSLFTEEAQRRLLSTWAGESLYWYYVRRIQEGKKRCNITGRIVIPKGAIPFRIGDNIYFWVDLFGTSFILQCYVVEENKFLVCMLINENLDEPLARKLITKMPSDFGIKREDRLSLNFIYEIEAGEAWQYLDPEGLEELTVSVEANSGFAEALKKEMIKYGIPVQSIQAIGG